MFRPALVLAVVIGLSTAHWEVYKKVHNKSYSKNEDALRKKIFEQTVERINHHNIHHDLGMTSFRMGLNFFSDVTDDEYRMYKGLKFNASNVHTGNPVFSTRGIQAGDIPDNVDWRKKGLVTPVKDQGQCGSCWSFSTTGAVEGQNAKKTGSLTSLSEQQLVDCSAEFGNNGCDGGLMDNAFSYIKSVGGIERENDYPYEGVQNDCRSSKKSFVATVSGFVDIPSGDEDALKKAIATVGPVSIAIDAGHPSFKSYKTGVYDEPECSSDQLDHGVLAIGYGSQDGVDFWLVKNSWDTVWGEAGYIKMKRNSSNQCGVASKASYPTM